MHCSLTFFVAIVRCCVCYLGSVQETTLADKIGQCTYPAIAAPAREGGLPQ